MDSEIADLLADLSHRFKARLSARDDADATDLSPFQAKALAFIGRVPGATQHELVERSGRDKAQVARIVKELEERGLVTRHPDARDGRVQRLELSTAGAEQFARLLRRRAAIAADMMRGLSPAEQQALGDLLRRLRKNLD